MTIGGASGDFSCARCLHRDYKYTFTLGSDEFSCGVRVVTGDAAEAFRDDRRRVCGFELRQVPEIVL